MFEAHDVTSVWCLLAECLHSVQYHLSDGFHIGAIGNAKGNGETFVLVVSGQVFEVLAEEVGVEYGDDATFKRGDLCALICDAFHLAEDAVVFDIVTYTHAARHKRDAVEEVFQQTFRCKAHAG